MIKLFGLELRRNPMKRYLLTILTVAVILLGLTYLFAYIPHKNSNIAVEMAIVNAIAPVFSNYRSIAALTSILSMVCFAVFSAAVFNQFIIHDFTGKQFYLLLSYPVKKSTVFLAKTAAAITVSILAMLFCNAIVFSVFYYMETKFPVVMGGTLSKGIFYDTVILSLLFSVISTAIGLISMRVGFIKKSSHITLIISFVCSALLSNLLGVSLLADLNAAMIGFTIFAVVLSISAIVLTVGLTHRINQMEGE